jgi:Fe-S cluster assembly scaffold protein SufB
MFVDLTTNPNNKLQVINIDKPNPYFFFIFNRNAEIKFNINVPKSLCYFFGLYVGAKKNNFKLKIIQNHTIGGNKSSALVHGLFFDKSSFDYQGLIRIEKNSVKVDSDQHNHNLIMSESAKVKTSPALEILNNDVQCSHGTTISRPNEDEINYMASRGLEKSEAIKLISQGFVKKLFAKLEFLMNKNEVESKEKKYIENKLKKYQIETEKIINAENQTNNFK